MQKQIFRNTLFSLLALLMVFTFGCNKKTDEAGNASMLSGNGSKTWRASRETTASGEKDKLQGDEKKERITFYSNGKFSMTSPTDQQNGTWNYDATSRTVAFQFEGADVTQNFQVEKLEEDEATLRAPSGATMELKAE